MANTKERKLHLYSWNYICNKCTWLDSLVHGISINRYFSCLFYLSLPPPTSSCPSIQIYWSPAMAGLFSSSCNGRSPIPWPQGQWKSCSAIHMCYPGLSSVCSIFVVMKHLAMYKPHWSRGIIEIKFGWESFLKHKFPYSMTIPKLHVAWSHLHVCSTQHHRAPHKYITFRINPWVLHVTWWTLYITMLKECTIDLGWEQFIGNSWEHYSYSWGYSQESMNSVQGFLR